MLDTNKSDRVAITLRCYRGGLRVHKPSRESPS